MARTMKSLRARTLSTLIGFSLILCVTKAYSGEGTTLPISAELGSSIAADLFPVTLNLSIGNVFLTEPRLLFRDNQRVSLQASFQAYDHRPEEGIAVSETGHAIISGRLDYDLVSRQILLHDPRIDELTFDQTSGVTQDLHHRIKAAWSALVTNPIRSEIPTHPYTLLIKDNIQALSYDGKRINLTVLYE
jgi:hypothetical protein